MFRAWRGDELPAELGDGGSWTSPVVEVPGGFAELVPSWNADTPPGTWVEVRARAAASDGGDTGWLVLARWAADDPSSGGAVARTTVRGQSTPQARVDTDTLVAAVGSSLVGWQLRVTAHAVPGAAAPALSLVAAVASPVRPDAVPACEPSTASGRVLDVTRLSQQRHRGHCPQWDGGGESWCSPTSVAMVLRHWGTGPTDADLAWVAPHDDPADRVVEHAVRAVWDEGYGGAGNWAFNTAYAAGFGLEAYVTRLRSLRDAEAFVDAGIPLVCSVRFSADDLPEAGYATTGHLLVLCGLTCDGDVVVNDPASHGVAENDSVPAVFNRTAFERAWLTGSAGTVYVVHPASVPLPSTVDGAPW